MWYAIAEYEDGTTIERYFEDSNRMTDEEIRSDIESWLIGRHDGCTFYS